MNSGQSIIREDIFRYSSQLDGPSVIGLRGAAAHVSSDNFKLWESDWFEFPRARMFYVETGFTHITTNHGSSLLPPNRVGWIPPNTRYKVRVSGKASGVILMISPELCDRFRLPDIPRIITINEVLKSLLFRIAEWNKEEPLTQDQELMLAVLFNEFLSSPEESLYLPMPKTQRVKKITDTILQDPSVRRNLDELASLGAMSSRTLRRLFLAETGLSFSQWRQQAQLAHSLDMLAKGVSVANVSDTLGYATPSNFITMFKRSFGETPKKYFSKN